MNNRKTAFWMDAPTMLLPAAGRLLAGTSPNAFATGRNPRHAAIVVNRGPPPVLGAEETGGVLAHEFAQVRNRDILIGSVVAVLAGAITMIANLARWSLCLGGGHEDEEGGESIPGFVPLVVTAILAPQAAMLIRLAGSGRALAGLFSTHPPFARRIARLDAMVVDAPVPAR